MSRHANPERSWLILSIVRSMFMTSIAISAGCVDTLSAPMSAADPSANQEQPPAAADPEASMAISFAPNVSWKARLGSAPLRGKYWVAPEIAPEPRGSASSAPIRRVIVLGGADRPPSDALELSGDNTGLTTLSLRELERMVAATSLIFYAEGKKHEHNDANTIAGIKCAYAIEQLRQDDACASSLPANPIQSQECQDEGATAWREAQDGWQRRVLACWAQIDSATIARVKSLSSRPVRDAACSRLAEHFSLTMDLDVSGEFIKTCPGAVSESDKAQVREAVQIRKLERDYARVKDGSSEDMQRFYYTYYDTGDPRVEEIRKLAAAKFGPKNPSTFLAAKRRVAAMSSPSFNAILCDIKDGKAYASAEPTAQAGFAVFGGMIAGGGQDALARGVRAQEISKRNMTSAIKSLTGVKEVLFPLMGSCQDPHWYFNDRPWPPPVKKPKK